MSVLIPTMIGKHHLKLDMPGEFSNKVLQKCLTTTKHRGYIIALIDDASRFITGIDVFYNDNFINLMSVMRAAIAKYGRP